MKIAIIGATGCIGSTLIANLLQTTTHDIIASFRSEKSVDPCFATKRVTWKKIDLKDENNITDFLTGTDILVYLIHSLESQTFETIDVALAQHVGNAAKQAKIKKIIYMGVLTPQAKNLSLHLQTKQETGNMLASFGIPMAEIRISILLAKCSASYKMLTTIAQKFPYLVGPKELDHLCAPIAVEDVVLVIIKLIDKNITNHEFFELGSDILSYKELIQLCSKSFQGVRNTIVTVPFLPKKFVYFITPLISGIQSSLVSALIGSLYSGNSIPVINQFKEITGKNPIPVEEALRNLIKSNS